MKLDHWQSRTLIKIPWFEHWNYPTSTMPPAGLEELCAAQPQPERVLHQAAQGAGPAGQGALLDHRPGPGVHVRGGIMQVRNETQCEETFTQPRNFIYRASRSQWHSVFSLLKWVHLILKWLKRVRLAYSDTVAWSKQCHRASIQFSPENLSRKMSRAFEKCLNFKFLNFFI